MKVLRNIVKLLADYNCAMSISSKGRRIKYFNECDKLKQVKGEKQARKRHRSRKLQMTLFHLIGLIISEHENHLPWNHGKIRQTTGLRICL